MLDLYVDILMRFLEKVVVMVMFAVDLASLVADSSALLADDVARFLRDGALLRLLGPAHGWLLMYSV